MGLSLTHCESSLDYLDPYKNFLTFYISETLNNQHSMRFKGHFPCLSQETVLYIIFFICFLKDVLTWKVSGREIVTSFKENHQTEGKRKDINEYKIF